MIVKQSQYNERSYLGISEIGELHNNGNKQNQDAVEFFSLNDSFTVAVSDGLGSCERSQIGANTATMLCSRILFELEDNRLKFEGQYIAQRFAAMWTQEFSCVESRHYSATIKAVFSKGDELVAISIGDGMLYILSGEETLIAPSSADGFINETVCLTHGIQPAAIWTGSIKKNGSTVIFLSTDGISNGISEGRELEMIREIGLIKDTSALRIGLENMIREMANYNSDDKTVGVVKL